MPFTAVYTVFKVRETCSIVVLLWCNFSLYMSALTLMCLHQHRTLRGCGSSVGLWFIYVRYQRGFCRKIVISGVNVAFHFHFNSESSGETHCRTSASWVYPWQRYSPGLGPEPRCDRASSAAADRETEPPWGGRNC